MKIGRDEIEHEKTDDIFRMFVKNAEISENKTKRKVSFRLTVDVYYPESECPEYSNTTDTTGKSLCHVHRKYCFQLRSLVKQQYYSYFWRNLIQRRKMVNMKNGETNWKIQYCLRRRWQHCACYALILSTIMLASKFLFDSSFFHELHGKMQTVGIDVCILELFRKNVIPKVASFLFIYLSPSQNDIHSLEQPVNSLSRSDW